MPGGYNALMAYPPRDAQPAEDNVNALWNGSVVPGTRGTIFPAAQYDDGQYHLAWPNIIAAPVEGFQNMWERGDEANISNPDALSQSSRESFDAAGLAATGGLAASAVSPAARGTLGRMAPAEHKLFIEGGAQYPGGAANYQAMIGPHQVGRAYVRHVGDDNIQLGQLHVDEPFQRRGIGTALQHHAEQDLGKPAIPDVYMSEKEYGRWLKNDPQAVDGYWQNEAGSWQPPSPYSGMLREALGKTDEVSIDDILAEIAALNAEARSGASSAGMVGAVPEGAVAANGLKFANSPNAASVPLALNAMEKPGWAQRVQSFREQLPQASEANDFTVNSPFPYVGLDELPSGTAQFMDGAQRRGQEAVNLSDLITHQRGVFGPNVEGIAKSGADGWTYDGKPLNAPTVYKLPTGELLLQDGNHRLSAAALNGETQALVDMFYANHPFASASPLAFTDYEEQQNALMPSSLSKKEKDHHSLTQPRTASGQFTR